MSIAITQVNFEPEEVFSKSRIDHSAFQASIAKRAVDKMDWSTINQSVLLYGWRENIVTATSNQIVAGRLLKALEDQEREMPLLKAF